MKNPALCLYHCLAHGAVRRTIEIARCGQWLAAALGLALFSEAQAASTLPFYESFPTNYIEGEQIGSSATRGGRANGTSGNIWDFGNSVSSSSGRIRTVGALGYPGLVTAPLAESRGLVGPPTAGTSGKSIAANLDAVTNTTLYASFLLNLQALPSATRSIAGLSTDNGSGGNAVGNLMAGVFVDTAGRLLVSKNSTTTPATNATYALTTNVTYLVVFRYKFNAGTSSNDEVALWLNPTSLGNDNTIPTATITTTNGNDATFMRSFGCMGPLPIFAYWMDEIRVSTNWVDVTPPSCSPGSVFNVTGGGTACVGTGFPVGLSGSQSGVDYWLLTNGVSSGLVLPGTGTTLSFGSQTVSALYTVLASNTVSACMGWMSGSATVASLTAPGIVSPPSGVTASAGSSVTISVAASGDVLTYQWRRNGTNLVNGGNISGATSANLTIYPVAAADAVGAANGYDVVVTGTCTPPATSTRVALTLKTQSNLIWAGDGSANLWDVATSANWLENNAPVVFNFGDKVTFDDTSANTAVTLASSFLSPALITVSGSQTYGFRPGGNISGAGTSLLMNGTGTLFVTNANSFAGGTTISNGQISINNNSSLGSGTITLAGGILDVLNNQVALANSINVTADSTIAVHNTSTSALQLDGSLSGTAGTLTINNATAASPTVRLTPTNLVFGRPLVLNVGTGTGLLLACYNTNGDQTFNGAISGGGRLERRTTDANAGSGNTILNAQNTYSGGTLLRDGGFGLGVSSVSAAPPTVDSGPLGTGTVTNDTGSPAYMRLFAVGGARTVGNAITWLTTNVGPALVITGANDLTLSGPIDLAGTNRTLQVDNTGRTILSGDISNGSLTKTGSGVLLINGNLLATDPIVINAGTFGGSGVFSGPVTIAAGATLAPGGSIGTLTINNDLTLQGNVLVEVNKSVSPSNDFVTVSGVLNNIGTGTVTVNNLGAALVIGDRFKLFDKPVQNGAALTVSGAGVTWANNLAVDGTISVASVTASKPVIYTTVIIGGNLIFSGTNGTGTAGGNYYVLSSTNVTLPLTGWARESTNVFGPGGYFSVTNAVSSGIPGKFYVLQLP